MILTRRMKIPRLKTKLSDNFFHQITATTITHFKSLPTHSLLGASPFAFEAELQVNLKNEAEMRAWVPQLGEHQKTTWRVTRGQKGKGKRIKCSLIYHCQHHRKSQLKGKKRLANEGKPIGPRDTNTICPGILRIKLAETQRLSPTNLYYTHPCKVFLSHAHNHPVIYRFGRG